MRSSRVRKGKKEGHHMDHWRYSVCQLHRPFPETGNALAYLPLVLINTTASFSIFILPLLSLLNLLRVTLVFFNTLLSFRWLLLSASASLPFDHSSPFAVPAYLPIATLYHIALHSTHSIASLPGRRSLYPGHCSSSTSTASFCLSACLTGSALVA